jgi:hypothetical protein
LIMCTSSSKDVDPHPTSGLMTLSVEEQLKP